MEKKKYTYTETLIYQKGEIEKVLVAVDERNKTSTKAMIPSHLSMVQDHNELITNLNNSINHWGDTYYSSLISSDYCARQFKNLAYSCICFRGENVAKSKPFMYKKINQSDKDEINTHPFLDSLENPNEFDTYYELLFETLKDLDLFGNAFWEIVRDRGKIKFYLLPAQKERWKFNYETGQYILSISNDKKITYEYHNILHFRNPTASRKSIFGMSLIEAGKDIFETENYISTYQKNFFKNDAMLKFYLSSTLSFNDGEFKRFKESYFEQTQGSENAGNTFLFPNGIEPKILSANPKEADYVETWRIIQTRTLSLFRISPSLLGIVEDVNRANAVSAYRDFVNFILDNIVKKIDARLTKFVKDEYGSQYFISSKIELPIDKDFELKRLESACRYGLITINEGRKDVGNYDSLVIYDDKGNPTKELDPTGNELVGGDPEEFIPPVKPDPNNPVE